MGNARRLSFRRAGTNGRLEGRLCVIVKVHLYSVTSISLHSFPSVPLFGFSGGAGSFEFFSKKRNVKHIIYFFGTVTFENI